MSAPEAKPSPPTSEEQEKAIDESEKESFPASDSPAHQIETPSSTEQSDDEDAIDLVDEASEESFPASDPPG